MYLTSGIYAITNTESGKVYIGSTVNLRRRMGRHRSRLCAGKHHNPHLQAAWNRYGEDAFEFGVLEYLDRLDELHLAEQFWMDIYREEGRALYNHGLAARHPLLGIHPSEETKRKLSEANKGKRHTEEHRRKTSEAHKGKRHTKETRRKISEALKGRKQTPEHCARIAAARAKPYPAFINKFTDEIIPAGVNLKALCRVHGWDQPSMRMVQHGVRSHHKGWMLLRERRQPRLL